MTSLIQLKDEYNAALYKAATEAASVIEAALASDKTSYTPLEPDRIDLALKLLAIVQGAPSPEKWR